MELLEKAWAGWINYTTQGKLVALLTVVLLYFWFYKREKKNELVVYATVASVFCIFPLVAAVLMAYQTKFYDYEWIWSVVPLTVVVAYGLTCFLADLFQSGKLKKRTTGVLVTVSCVVVLLLCGSMGAEKEDSYSVYINDLYPYRGEPDEALFRQRAYEVVENLSHMAGGEELVLWAPVELMEYVREADAGIRLLYGRNMWDESLNAYSYDTYDEVVYHLYLWMELRNVSYDVGYLKLMHDVEQVPSTEICVQRALEQGVNCILLPDETAAQEVQEVAKLFGGEVQQIEEYWVIYE